MTGSLKAKRISRDLTILGSFSAFCSDSFPHPGMPRSERLEHLSAKILGLTGGHLMIFGMDLQAWRYSGKACRKGVVRLERL